MIQDLHRQGREAAAGLVGRALHEQHHVVLGDGVADEGVDGVGGLNGVGHGMGLS